MDFIKSLGDSITEKIFNAIFGKIADIISSILIGLTDGIINDLNPSHLNTFFSWIGFNTTTFAGDLQGKSWFTYESGGNTAIDLFAAFALIGFVLAIIIFVLNLFSLGLGDVVDVKESPMVMVARFGIALLLVGYSNSIISLFLTVTGNIWYALFSSSIVSGSAPIESAGTLLADVFFSSITAIPNMIVSIICAIIVIKRLLSYLVDMISSYLMIVFLYMLLPACAGTFASKKTDVLGAYFRMLISTYVLTLTKIVMFRFALLAVTSGIVGGDNTLIIGPINDTLVILAFLELGTRCDGVLKGIGLSPASTGGRLLDSISGGVRSMINDATMPMRMARLAGGYAHGVGNRAMNNAMTKGNLADAGKAAVSANMGDQHAAMNDFMKAQKQKGFDQYQAAANAKASGAFGGAWTSGLEGQAKVGEAMQTLNDPNATNSQKQDAVNKFKEGYAAAHGGQAPEGKDLDKLLNTNGIHLPDDFKYGENGYMNLDDEMKNGNMEAERYYKNASGFNDAVNFLQSGHAMENPEEAATSFDKAKKALERMHGGAMTDEAVASALNLRNPEMLYGKNGIAARSGADGSVNLDNAVRKGDKSAAEFYKQASGYNDAMSLVRSGNGTATQRADAFDTIRNAQTTLNGGKPMTDAAVVSAMSKQGVRFSPAQLYGKDGIASRPGADGSVSLDKDLSPTAANQERSAAVAYMNSLGSIQEKRAAAPQTIAGLEESINKSLGKAAGTSMEMHADNVRFANDGSTTLKMVGNGMPSMNASVGADGVVTPLAADGSQNAAGEGAARDAKNWHGTVNSEVAESSGSETFGAVRQRKQAIEGAEAISAYLSGNGVSMEEAGRRMDLSLREDSMGGQHLEFHGQEISDVEKTSSGIDFHDKDGNVVSYTATDRKSGEEVTARGVTGIDDVENAFASTGPNAPIVRQAVECGALDSEVLRGGKVRVEDVSDQPVSELIAGAKQGDFFMNNTYALVSEDAQGNRSVTGFVKPINSSSEINDSGKAGRVVYDKNTKNAGAYKVYKNDDQARREVSRQRSER